MGWLFKAGLSRKDLIEERTKDWERTQPDGTVIKTTCLAQCYRGASFCGVLWSVWERTFSRDGQEVQSKERWIVCDLLRYQGEAWGYKDIEECMGPYYYSCPLKYLDLVPLDIYGGNVEWREQVREHHARKAEKRRARKAARHR